MTRVPLRRYRWARQPWIEAGPDTVSLQLPAYFGKDVVWSIPTEQVRVVDDSRARPAAADAPAEAPAEAPADAPAEAPDEAPWATVDPIRIPYAATTSRNTAPNLRLVFDRPVRVPRLRYVAGMDPQLPGREARSEAGLWLDGISLRAVEPEVAVRELVVAGVRAVADADEVIRATRQITTDVAEVHRVARSQEQAARWQTILYIGGLAGLIGSRLWDVDWLLVAGLVALLGAYLAPRWLLRSGSR